MISETNIRDILSSYFNEYGIVSHQIGTFDHLIKFDLQEVVLAEPPIKVQYKKGCYYVLSFGDIYVPPASFIDENRIIRRVNPREARDRNLTYDTPIYVDITETHTEESITREKKHARVMIGRIPVMIGSVICNLHGMTTSERVEAGECEFDKGGYFIVNGKERVLVGQLRGLYNKVLVRSKNDKWAYLAEVRSMSEETGHSVLLQAYIGVDSRTIVFSIPYIKEMIPAGILFRALGYDQTMIKQILGLGPEYDKYIKYIIRDSCMVNNQEDALKFIGQFTLHVVKEDKQLAYARQVVETEILPHLGISSTNKEKVYFLSMMVGKLLRTHMGIRGEDDRDNYINKRVDMAGVLCRDLFRTLFKRFIKSIFTQMTKKKQAPDAISIIARTNSITTGLKYSFGTGNWGVQKNTYVRVGVSQILSQITYGAKTSNLRRIVIPIGKEGKNSKIRQLHSSQIFYICPCETPEGPTAGIVMNLALLTQVTNRIPTVLVRSFVENCSDIILINSKIDPAHTTIFINGILIGTTSSPQNLISELKNARVTGSLGKSISMSFNKTDGEINIYSDEGRFIRPVFTLGEDHTKLKLVELGIQTSLWNSLVDTDCIQYIDHNECEEAVIAMKQVELTQYNNDFCEISESMMFGVMASIIPFPDHAQAPRNTYEASMAKQALGIYALSHNIRSDTITYVMDYVQKPLVVTQAAKMIGFDDLPCGLNAIVAVCTYGGTNQEDSILVNKGAVDLGMFTVSSYRTLYLEEKKHSTLVREHICLPIEKYRKIGSNYHNLDKNGIAKKGSILHKGDVVIGRVIIKTSKDEDTITDCSLTIKGGEDGVVDRVFVDKTPAGHKLVKVVMRSRKIPEKGDKFASRCGQKATTGLVVSREDMPFSESGIIPDLIINPQCLPSRMTLNQLLECVLSKSCAIDGTIGDATPFTQASENIAEKLCDKLDTTGFERHGYEKMYNGYTGLSFDSEIFIGPVYYQRLKHMVEDKIHCRAYGQVTNLNRQPPEGRSKDGGLRMGEMEKDACVAHGISRFLRDRLFEQSDKYEIIVCGKCGQLATSKEECKACSTTEVYKVNMPYSANLLITELKAMSIKAVITTNSS